MSHISNRWTNNEGLVDIKKCNLYFYSSTATIVCSRNTFRETSHISFFSGGDPFCEVVRRPENTHGELTGLLEWHACLCLQAKITDLIFFSSPMRIYEYPLRPRIFLFMTGYRNLHNSWVFSGNLLILSANRNICHSIHRQKIIFSSSSFIFFFPVKPLCWCYLATALDLVSSSTALGR